MPALPRRRPFPDLRSEASDWCCEPGAGWAMVVLLLWQVGCGRSPAPENAPAAAPPPGQTAVAESMAPVAVPNAGEGVEGGEAPVNFVVFDIDSLRADHFHGGPGLPPNLRWLKQRGTLFARTYPPAGWTLPSVVSMLAGQVAPAEALLPESDPTTLRLLPGILAAYGYHTGVAWGDTLLDRHPRRLSWLSGELPATDYGTARGFAEAVTRGAVEEPFFVLLHDEDLHTALMGKHLRSLPPRDAEVLARQQYRQALGEYDRSVGHVLSALWDGGLSSRTVVVVLSDHGEAIYEHGALGHGDLLWEEVARVPMLVVDPAVGNALRVDESVSTLDLAPTLLERAGIPRHAQMRGRSLLPALRGQKVSGKERAFVLDSDMEAGAVVVGDWKLVVHPHGCPEGERTPFPPLAGTHCMGLYQLSTDPGERRSRVSEQPERVADLRAALTTGLQSRSTPALDEYAVFLSELQQRGYWEAAKPR